MYVALKEFLCAHEVCVRRFVHLECAHAEPVCTEVCVGSKKLSRSLGVLVSSDSLSFLFPYIHLYFVFLFYNFVTLKEGSHKGFCA